MPDQAGAPAPGSAPQGAGSAESQTPPAGTPAEGGAEQGGGQESGGQDALVSKILDAVKSENKKSWDAIQSSTDRKLSRVLQQMQQAPRGRSSGGEEYDDGSDAGSAGETQAPVAELDPETEEQIAMNAFQNRHPDFRDYWDDVRSIANDEEAAAPFKFLKVTAGGRVKVDVTRSLELIRLHVLNERESARKAEDDKGKVDTTKNTLRRDATISGQGNVEPTPVDTSKMTKKEKMVWLYENHPDMFDPDDLPEELRGTR